MLRDRYWGAPLTAVFSTVVTVLALSPALGPLLGTLLAARATATSACSSAWPCWPYCCCAAAPLLPVARRMGDAPLWAAAWLVAAST